MAGFGGISGLGGIGSANQILASVLTQPFQAAALRPGQVLQGLVQSIEPQTLIRFGTLVVPVEQVEALQPGQAVTAEVVRGEQGLQLRLTPAPQSQTQFATQDAVPSPLRNLPDLIVNTLQTLGKLEYAEQAVALVPRSIANNPAAVRLVLTLLLDREDSDDHAARLVRIVQQAVDDGALPETEVKDLLPLLRAVASARPEQIAPALRGHVAASQHPLAARLAEAVGKGGMQQLLASIAQDTPAALARLVDDEAFSEFLLQTGNAVDYQRGVEHLADRFAAAQLINSRGTEVPYLFLALPMPVDAPIRHAHIHVMGEGGGKAQRFDAANATVVLDLSTSALGDLWITLSAVHGACSCWIRARDVDAMTALQEMQDELAERLSRAGYPGANVQTALWDGDRVRELATMMRRFKGLNIEA